MIQQRPSPLPTTQSDQQAGLSIAAVAVFFMLSSSTDRGEKRGSDSLLDTPRGERQSIAHRVLERLQAAPRWNCPEPSHSGRSQDSGSPRSWGDSKPAG